jgi:hypothetical protein
MAAERVLSPSGPVSEMPYAQLHYTSCKNGLARYDGFQFCAMTPGLPAEIMREVEKQTVYQLPGGWAETADREAEAYPVNLLYTKSDQLDVTIIAQVRYAGRDFSNRPGNYFAHTLVAQRPDATAASLLPVELWDAPFWRNTRTGSTDLPVLNEPLRAGPVTPGAIDDFIAAEPRRPHFIRALLTAADIALYSDRKVLVISPDSDIICQYIAAVCYLLGPYRGPRLTFSTYTHDLRQVRTCIVGTLPGVMQRVMRKEIDENFLVFDASQADPPELRLSPTAVLLADQGVAACGVLWESAERLGAGPDDTLDELFPLLSCAALIEGRKLSSGQLDAAIAWLYGTTSEVAIARLADALSTACGSPVADLPSARQAQLVELAGRADGQSGSENGDQSLTVQVESLLAEGALRRLDSGSMPDRGFPFRTLRAMRIAAAEAQRRLPSADPSTAVAILRWAHEVGIDPGTGTVRDAGQRVVASWPLSDDIWPELSAAAEAWPLFRAGMVAALAGLSADRLAEFLRSDLAALLQTEDFSQSPVLGEEWLVAAAQAGRMTRSSALITAARLRRGDGGLEPIDERLISRIWQKNRWTFREGTEIVAKVPPEELLNEGVSGRLALLLQELPADASNLAPWTDFASTFASAAEGIYPHHNVSLAGELADVGRQIQSAYSVSVRSVATVESLMRRYSKASGQVRLLLGWHLPPLIFNSPSRHRLLRECPMDLFEPFCNYSRFMIESENCGLETIATLFLSMVGTGRNSLSHVRSRQLDEQVFRPTLSTWSKRDIRDLVLVMNELSHNSGSRLELWYRQYGKKRRIPWPRA